MGIDFQFISYRGPALSDASVAEIMRNHVPSAQLFRHSKGPLPEIDDLHCICLYEGPSERTHTLSFDLEGVQLHPDAPLSDVVKAAWKVMRAEFASRARVRRASAPADQNAEEKPDGDDAHRGLTLARELSRVTGASFWLSQGDHSCVGGYAQFQKGEVVDQATPDSVWVEGDAYLAIPAKKWSRALGRELDPPSVFLQAFPDSDTPPLRPASDPAQQIDFDPGQHEVCLE